MFFFRPLAIAGLIALVGATPALASTVPPVDLDDRHVQVSLGLATGAIDLSPIPGWTLGATAAVTSFNISQGDSTSHWAARLGARLWRSEAVKVGVVLSAGMATEYITHGLDPATGLFDFNRDRTWVQPALVGEASWGLPWREARLHLRASLGPSWSWAETGSSVTWLVPNAELALAFPERRYPNWRDGFFGWEPAHEFVVGGGGLVAYRLRL